MCQPGATNIAGIATPSNRAPDRSATTAGFGEAALPPRPALARIAPTSTRVAAAAPPTNQPSIPKRPALEGAQRSPQSTPPNPTGPTSPAARPPTASSAGATSTQPITATCSAILPGLLSDAMRRHNATTNDKEKKVIIVETVARVLEEMLKDVEVRKIIQAEVRRDPTAIDRHALNKDGELRVRCCRAIKLVLDKNAVASKIRPFFLR